MSAARAGGGGKGATTPLSRSVAGVLVVAAGIWLAGGHCRSESRVAASGAADALADPDRGLEPAVVLPPEPRPEGRGSVAGGGPELPGLGTEPGVADSDANGRTANEASGVAALDAESAPADAGEGSDVSSPGSRPAVDTSALPALLEERGFEEPSGGFLAYVIAMRFEDGRARIVAEKRYDHEGTSEEASGWNPASTVKLYAAIGALRRIHALGYGREATLTFRGTGEPQSSTLEALVRAAIGPSDNLAYDYLVVFAGFDWLHERLFTPENGFERTALRVAYDKGRWTRLGFSEWLRDSPDITIEEDGRTTELPAAAGDAEVACNQGSCTTPAELGETMRRVMLHEVLPAGERLGLRADDLELLREILASPRERGTEVVHELRPQFSADARFFHKPGYADEWFSDVVYIDDPALDRAWVVVLAGRPGRSCLDRVAELLGELLVEGRLDPQGPTG